jgi:hypothetical protein
VEWYWQAKSEELGENPLIVPLSAVTITQGKSWGWTLASAFGGLSLTAWQTGLKQNYAVYKTLFCTSQKTHHILITGSNPLILFRAIKTRDNYENQRKRNVRVSNVKAGGIYVYLDVSGLSRRDGLSSSSSWCVGLLVCLWTGWSCRPAGPPDNHLDL